MKNIQTFEEFLTEAKTSSEFKPHMMYDPKTGKEYKAETHEDHVRMAKLGYVHEKPEINEAKINDSDRFSEIFTFETKMPFGLPKGVMDFYVKRVDGKIGTYIWNDFEELIKSNPGIKFGSFANSSKVNIYEGLKDDSILVMREVHVIKNK